MGVGLSFLFHNCFEFLELSFCKQLLTCLSLPTLEVVLVVASLPCSARDKWSDADSWTYQGMFDKSSCSVLIKDDTWLGCVRLSFDRFDLLKVLLDSSQFAKHRVLLGLDAMEFEVC